MKHTISVLTGMAAMALLFSSCNKNDGNNSNPGNTTDTTKLDAGKLTASPWHGTGMYNLHYDRNTLALKGGDGASKYRHDFNFWWIDSLSAKFTFDVNGTYSHSRYDGKAGDDFYVTLIPNQGTWQALDNNTIVKMNLIGWSNTLVNYHVVSFKSNYMHLTYNDTTANSINMFNLEFER